MRGTPSIVAALIFHFGFCSPQCHIKKGVRQRMSTISCLRSLFLLCGFLMLANEAAGQQDTAKVRDGRWFVFYKTPQLIIEIDGRRAPEIDRTKGSITAWERNTKSAPDTTGSLISDRVVRRVVFRCREFKIQILEAFIFLGDKQVAAPDMSKNPNATQTVVPGTWSEEYFNEVCKLLTMK